MNIKSLPSIILTILLLQDGGNRLYAQSNCITLSQLIARYYKSNNVQLSILSKELKVKYLTYRNSLAAYNLSSGINFTVPYSKSIESVLQPDGNSIYIERQYMNPAYSVSASKKIPLTGGTIGITSSLSYFKNFLNTNQQFNANWYNLFISQPFFAYNEYKYDKKLQRLRLSADSIQYYKDREARLATFIGKVINYELLQRRIGNSELTIADNVAALEKVKLLYENGRMLAIDTLLLSNNLKQAHLQKDQLESELVIQAADLNYSFNGKYNFSICNIEELMTYDIDSALLRERYLNYNNQSELMVNAFISSENLKRVRKAHGIITSISAGNGINQTADAFDRLLANPAQKQNVTLAVSVPLTGWQTYKRNKEIAQLQYQAFEMTRNELGYLAGEWATEQMSEYLFLFRSYIYSKEKINGLEEVKRLQMEKVFAGRINISEYNVTESSINIAKLEQLDIIRRILLFRFELRAKTLYDFELKEDVF